MGLLLAAGAGASASVPYLGFQVRGSIASTFFYSQIAHAVLFILVIFIKLLLWWCRLGAFNAGELVVMFIFMSLGNASGTVLSYWMPLVAGPYYQANTENNWLPLVLGVQAASLCTMVLVQQRLIYPVMQVNLAMVQPDDRSVLSQRRDVARFFSTGDRRYYHWPARLLSVPAHDQHGFYYSVYAQPPELCHHREIAFGLWVFSVPNIVQANFYSMSGWGMEKEAAISVWSYGNHSLVHQSMGGMIVLVLGDLWVGREHLWGAARKVFSGATDVDDGEEILSYRRAVFGLLLSAAIVLVCLLRLNIPLPSVIGFMFFGFVVFMALTRVVVEGGVAVIYSPLVAPAAAVSALGSSVFGMRGMVGMAFTRTLANDLLNFTMPHIANGLKLSGLIRGSRRRLFWGMPLAILLGVGS